MSLAKCSQHFSHQHTALVNTLWVFSVLIFSQTRIVQLTVLFGSGLNIPLETRPERDKKQLRLRCLRECDPIAEP